MGADFLYDFINILGSFLSGFKGFIFCIIALGFIATVPVIIRKFLGR